MLLVLALCTFWDDKALKSVPSGELGVTKDKTSFAKASKGKITPTYGSHNERGGLQKSKSGRPRILFLSSSSEDVLKNTS